MGLILPPSLVEIRLTDVLKSGGVKAHPGMTDLTSSLRIKEKELLFVDSRSNFTIPFSEKECDFENGARLEDKLSDKNNLLDDKVIERTANCSNYLNSLFEIVYRKGNKLFDK